MNISQCQPHRIVHEQRSSLKMGDGGWKNVTTLYPGFAYIDLEHLFFLILRIFCRQRLRVFFAFLNSCIRFVYTFQFQMYVMVPCWFKELLSSQKLPSTSSNILSYKLEDACYYYPIWNEMNPKCCILRQLNLKREGNILGATQNECMQFIRFNTNLYDTGWLNSCLRSRTLHALCNESDYYWKSAGLILGLRPANVTTSLTGWALA